MTRRFHRLCASLVASACVCAVPGQATERDLPSPNWVWTAAQFLPGIGEAFHAGGQGVWLRWQVTPVLYSFAMRRGISPWRFLIAEPPARVGGSLELHVSPEYLHLPDHGWTVSAGVRAWLPVYMRGDYLAASVGVQDLWWRDRQALGLEAGFAVLFGILGAQAVWLPSVEGRPAWLVGTRLRIF